MSIKSTNFQLSSESGKSCICLCGLKFPSRINDKCPDHLRHWERWIQRRKRIHEQLFRKLRRDPASLLMNSGDCYRSIQEEKSILEYTQIETHFDKYRGNPEFWTLPCALKEKVPPYKSSEYFAIKSKAEKNQVPELEYVGVPDYIYNEKNVGPKTRYLKERWTKSCYRNQVVKRMSEKLAEIQPHKPDLDQLIVVGSAAPKANDVHFPKVKTLAKQPKSIPDFEECTSKTEFTEPSKISIKICDKKIIQGQYLSREDRISMLFEYFIGRTTNKPTEKILSLENTGLVTLRLSWLKFNKLKLFREFTESDIVSKPFKFNKNQILLLPGQKIDFPVWFQIQKPGTYFEHWELNTEPKIWSEDIHFLVFLKGYAYIQNYQEKIMEVTLKLQKMIRDTSIKDFLNSVVDRGTYCHPTTCYVYDFSEEELFQSANLRKDLVKYSPKYVYNSTVLKELKSFYAEIKSPEDPKEWNLCVKNLIEVARKKDLSVYFEKKLELYKLAKERRKLLRESIETKKKSEPKAEDKGSTKDKGKKNPKALVSSNQQETASVLTYHEQLRSILSRLEQPSIQPNKQRLKMFFCYLILKTSIWTMLDKLSQLSTDFGQSVELVLSSRSSPTIVPDRLVYEIFEDSYILRTKRIPHQPGAAGAKPKPLNLKIDSGSDLKKIYKAYFGKDEGPKSVKGTKSPKDEGKSEAKSDGKKSKQKGKNQDDQLQEDIDPDFDPYREEFPSGLFESKTELPVRVSSTIDPKEPINHEKYLIVYTTLCNAVDTIVDTIEGFTQRSLRFDYLSALQKCETKTPIEEISPTQECLQNINEEEQRSQSQTDYFNFLLDTHWQTNRNTQKYFMKDKTNPLKDAISLTESQSSGTIIQMPASDMFSLKDFERKPVPYCLKDGTTQTDLCQYTPEEVEDDSDSKRLSRKSVGDASATEVFYILRNGNEQQSEESKSSLSQVAEDL